MWGKIADGSVSWQNLSGGDYMHQNFFLIFIFLTLNLEFLQPSLRK